MDSYASTASRVTIAGWLPEPAGPLRPAGLPSPAQPSKPAEPQEIQVQAVLPTSGNQIQAGFISTQIAVELNSDNDFLSSFCSITWPSSAFQPLLGSILPALRPLSSRLPCASRLAPVSGLRIWGRASRPPAPTGGTLARLDSFRAVRGHYLFGRVCCCALIVVS